MKTVFSNRQTVHVWAAQSQPSGRNSKNTLWFEDGALWSYRTPIALILPDNSGESVALISSNRFTPTTAQQMPSRRDVAPRPCFHVPYLPGLAGRGMSSAPPATSVTREESEGWTGDDWRALEVRNCHLGNLAHLVADAEAGIAEAVKRGRRMGIPVGWPGGVRDWSQPAAWIESEWSESLEPARAAARDYATRFGLPVPTFSPDYGRAQIMDACAAWHAKESDPATQRKRAASKRRREARETWLSETAAPILREAGLRMGNRYDRDAVRAALLGIPSTAAGASALRVRLADQIKRNAEHFERMERERLEREAAREAALAEQTARAEAAGFTLREWRDMFDSHESAMLENRMHDARAALAPTREAWKAGETVGIIHDYLLPYDLRHAWQRDDDGCDILRVKPSDPATLESARGAEVPLAHAKRAWRMILSIMCSGQSWTGSIRCGAFTISSITPQRMVAGCHTFSRAEMIRIASIIGEPVECPETTSQEGVAA